MAYSTQTDILQELDQATLIQLTDDNGTGGVSAAVVTAKIADADAEIDGYCGQRYTVPFATVPPIIKRASIVIAVKNLFGRRRGAPESRRQDYDDMIRFLKDISSGKATLGVDDPDGTPSASNEPDIESADRVFSRDKLIGF